MSNETRVVPVEFLDRIRKTCMFTMLDADYHKLCAILDRPADQQGEPVEHQDLDGRLRAAGMFSVADLMSGVPIDAFLSHAGMRDIKSFSEWVEMRCGEYLRLKAYREIEGRTNDDMYEWIEAHAAVFREVHVNLKAAMAQPVTDKVDDLLRRALPYLSNTPDLVQTGAEELATEIRAKLNGGEQ